MVIKRFGRGSLDAEFPNGRGESEGDSPPPPLPPPRLAPTLTFILLFYSHMLTFLFSAYAFTPPPVNVDQITASIVEKVSEIITRQVQRTIERRRQGRRQTAADIACEIAIEEILQQAIKDAIRELTQEIRDEIVKALTERCRPYWGRPISVICVDPCPPPDRANNACIRDRLPGAGDRSCY